MTPPETDALQETQPTLPLPAGANGSEPVRPMGVDAEPQTAEAREGDDRFVGAEPQSTIEGSAQADVNGPLGDVPGVANDDADSPAVAAEVVDQLTLPFATDTPEEQATRLITQIETDARAKFPIDARACAKEQVYRIRAILQAAGKRLEIL